MKSKFLPIFSLILLITSSSIGSVSGVTAQLDSRDEEPYEVVFSKYQ